MTNPEDKYFQASLTLKIIKDHFFLKVNKLLIKINLIMTSVFFQEDLKLAIIKNQDIKVQGKTNHCSMAVDSNHFRWLKQHIIILPYF